MENRLKNLKNLMDETTFSQLNFTEQQRQEIRAKIGKEDENESDILLAVLQLLIKEKTGYAVAKLLRGRGIRKFEDDEGALYALLHQLERDGRLQSNWNASNSKHYCLTNKGKKELSKLEKQNVAKKTVKNIVSLKQLIGGET